jgi:hypothetical protein
MADQPKYNRRSRNITAAILISEFWGRMSAVGGLVGWAG